MTDYRAPLHAVATIQVVRAQDLPQELFDFLLAFGYLRRDDTVPPGYFLRHRDIATDQVLRVFLGWYEEQHREIGALTPMEAAPDWSLQIDPPKQNLYGRFHSCAFFVPAEYEAIPVGPAPIGKKTKDNRETVYHTYTSRAPFVVKLAFQGRLCMAIRSIPTTRAQMQETLRS